MTKRTLIRLSNQFGKTIDEAVLNWEDEDGPTAEDVRDAAIGLINWHWLDAGDTLTVVEVK